MIAPWNRDLRVLELEVRRREYATCLRELHEANPETRGLASWASVAEFVQAAGIRSANSDRVLLPLVTALAASADPILSTLLYYLFVPSLGKLHRSKRHWLSDPQDRWAFVYEGFLVSLRRIDPSLRQERLGQKLLNDTARRLYDECSRLWRLRGRFMTCTPDEFDLVSGGYEDPEFAAVESRCFQDSAARHVRTAAASGVISLTDAHLFLGTRIYGDDLMRAALEVGLPYETARKRRHRAEVRLRRGGGRAFR
ncbi:MAG: hypothetical protein ABI960_07535 [Candidatus Eisenbacteria bacterium]